MNHPLIPPDSEYFYSTTLQSYAFLPLPEKGRCYRLKVDDAEGGERIVLSALAEREWRIRAERWADLWLRYYRKTTLDNSDRQQAFAKEETQCLLRAREWRTWGLQEVK